MGAFIFSSTFLFIEKICSSKISSEFIWIKLDSTKAPPKLVFFGVLKLKRRWLFSGLAFMWLLLNHVKNVLVVSFNSEITVTILKAYAYGVASSAQLSMSESSHVRRRISIEFILKSNRPKIEPYRTPYSIYELLLKHLFVLVRWLRWRNSRI